MNGRRSAVVAADGDAGIAAVAGGEDAVGYSCASAPNAQSQARKPVSPRAAQAAGSSAVHDGAGRARSR